MFSPTAIADFLACQHLTALKKAELTGQIKRPFFADPGLEVLKKLGLAHEEEYLRRLTDERGMQVVRIPEEISWTDAASQTIKAMRKGADAIYQATFLQSAIRTSTSKSSKSPLQPSLFTEEQADPLTWFGRADFLLRVNKPSVFGNWSYEVVETKLARSTKVRAIIQLCFYSDLLSNIQRVIPDFMHVVLGGGEEPEKFFVQKYLAYFRKVRREFEAADIAAAVTYPEPVEHCRVCDWSTVCDERWHADDHLSLVAGITRNQRKALVEVEVNTMVRLATMPLFIGAESKGDEGRPRSGAPTKIAPAPLFRIREQARMQVEGRQKGKPVYELLGLDELKDEKPRRRGETETTQRGLAALPLPSPGDLFLDFEGDPFAFDQGLEYLIGTVTIKDGVPIYESTWSFDPKSEKHAFEEFIAKVKQIRERFPAMHIYHYAPYEPTAIKHLAGRHGVCTEEVDELLRAEVFVDLHRVVRQSLRGSVESYSIKKMEAFYDFTRTVPLRDATSSLQAFEAVLALGDKPEEVQEILKTIADYNCDDCLSTWKLRAWLEQLRTELETKVGNSIPRPEPKSGAPGDELQEQLTEVTELKERLVGGLPEDEAEWTNEQRASWLLAQLLEWHRREDKSMWWEYYRLCELSNDELIEDKNALGGLVYVGVVEEVKKSLIHRYSFPVQDHAIDRALEVHDPSTMDSAGTLVEVDELNLTIDLKRAKNSAKPHPTGLIPHDYVSSKKQVESLMRIARWVAEKGVNHRDAETQRTHREFQAARDALLRRAPRIAGTNIQSVTKDVPPLEAAKKLVLALDCSILAIQGPPGSGKTYTGAQMIIELIKAGKRVGITAGSHKVICNLMSAVGEAAEEGKTKLSIVQKITNSEDGHEHPSVTVTKDNAVALEKLRNGTAQVAAGTSWLWSREEFVDSIDVLFVDEAGQMSLANVLAVSPAAKSVVLLGDPQQLDQPQKGVHPPGAEVSALAHLLNGRATIDRHQGLFLAESWRLHPDICAFTSEVFYEGRLYARAENTRQRLNADGPLDGTGLRFVPVTHSGNQSDSPEEVERIAGLIEVLLQKEATWTNKKGETLPLTLKDILIVAPYNAQVALLACRLPKGARVGTVDKFQGQEAPVVFYSMTTSTPEDAPRGMEFLYSSNRLNVATSRAQCVTVLVANPVLFEVQCRTPRQIELANAFCRYLEMSQ
jgi:uncharacterized protein